MSRGTRQTRHTSVTSQLNDSAHLKAALKMH